MCIQSGPGYRDSPRAGRSGDLIPVGAGGEIFRTFPDRPGSYPAYYKMGTGSLPWGYNGRELALTTHPHLAPRLKSE